MVSTRGGARTGADDAAESELKLRKKPVRKAATTKTTKAAAPAKTTRSKKTEPEPEDEEVDELQREGEESLAVAVTVPQVTRKGRAKKDETTTAAPSKPAAGPRARTTTTAAASKTATTRTKKPSKVETAAAPDLPPPAAAKAKATRATRATASTRATAAKEKAPPLSPKKITQVSKAPPARSTKTTAAKAVAAKGEGQAAVKARPTTRRRVVSDENAGVPEFRPSTAEWRGEEEVKPKQTSTATPVVDKPESQPEAEPKTIEIDNGTPMSTRPTTPTQSHPEVNELDEPTIEDEVLDSASDVGGEVEISADELCGPKTPMKRLSPRERAKYASAQKNPRLEDVRMKTPVRRFLVLGSQGGTPQTQKPYCKPSLPMSEVRPTTVARARDRAMVFPKLQPLVTPREVEDIEETADDEDTTVTADGENDRMGVDQFDLSTLSVEVMEQDGESDQKHDKHRLANEEQTSSTHESEYILNHDRENDSVSDVDRAVHDIVAIPFNMEDISTADHDDDDPVESEFEGPEDPNETILVDQDMEDGLDSQADTSLGSEESVIRHEMMTEAENSVELESMEDIRLPATTPRPETIVWENLREDVTIPFNFDSELTSSRGLTSGEGDEPRDFTSARGMETSDGSEAGVGVVGQQDAPDAEVNMALADIQYERQRFGDVRLSVDATVNLSEFLDVSSLAEQPSQTVQDKTNDDEMDLDQEEAHSDEVDASMHEATDVPQEHHDISDHAQSSPAREIVPTLPNVPRHEPQHEPQPGTPHYAMPTIAFRRKSLPAIMYHTPMKDGARPKTSDGHSIPRIANPFISLSNAEGKSQHELTPFRGRDRTTLAQASVTTSQTPSASRLARSRSRTTPRTSGRASVRHTPHTSGRLSARPTPMERFPGLPSRQTYEELASTPVAKSPRRSMPSVARSNTKERLPALSSAETYEHFSSTPAPGSATTKEPVMSQAEDPATPQVEEDINVPKQEERYPGLPHRRTYEEHARTAMPSSRFRTPSQSPAKRPATVQRPASLRKMALRGSHTPVKTPLRAPAMTPGQVPLTPHPGAPLRGVNAYVDVFLNDGSSANSTYIAVLHSLGAKTTKTFNDRVTHVIFKEGSPATLQRLRLHNKQLSDSSRGKTIFCVNGRWVNDSNSEGARMDENDEAYSVDIEDQRATKRRRKSMEPTSLLNIGGNVVRDTNRKSSLGRSSLGRALKAGSPSVDSPSAAMSIDVDVAEKENSGDSSFGDGSPMTPAYLAAPNSLVQQTAPTNRVRKLDFDAQEQVKSRRLTFWDGGEF